MLRLHTYTKETIRVLGKITVEVTYKEQLRMLPLLVVAGEGPRQRLVDRATTGLV